MTDYAEILRKLEQETKVISDDSLRRIAFERLLNHELSATNTTVAKKIREATTGEQSEAAGASRRSRTKTRVIGASGTSIREQIKNLQISPDEEGLPAWGNLGALEKYLWVLEAAQKKGINGLTGVEISQIIHNVFKENHASNQVSNLKGRLKKAHVRAIKIPNGSTQLTGYQILKGGTEHLLKQTNAGEK